MWVLTAEDHKTLCHRATASGVAICLYPAYVYMGKGDLTAHAAASGLFYSMMNLVQDQIHYSHPLYLSSQQIPWIHNISGHNLTIASQSIKDKNLHRILLIQERLLSGQEPANSGISVGIDWVKMGEILRKRNPRDGLFIQPSTSFVKRYNLRSFSFFKKLNKVSNIIVILIASSQSSRILIIVVKKVVKLGRKKLIVKSFRRIPRKIRNIFQREKIRSKESQGRRSLGFLNRKKNI